MLVTSDLESRSHFLLTPGRIDFRFRGCSHQWPLRIIRFAERVMVKGTNCFRASCVPILALQLCSWGNLLSASVSFICKMERTLNALIKIACWKYGCQVELRGTIVSTQWRSAVIKHFHTAPWFKYRTIQMPGRIRNKGMDHMGLSKRMGGLGQMRGTLGCSLLQRDLQLHLEYICWQPGL